MRYSFTIEELQTAIKDFPPEGFFVALDHALYYDFSCDVDYRIPEDDFPLIDVYLGGDGAGNWEPADEHHDCEKMNHLIAAGIYDRFRYIVAV